MGRPPRPRPVFIVILVALAVAIGGGGAEAAKRLRVITTIPDLKSLTEAVGGDLVDVDTLARGNQNAHEAEVRPTMMLKLRRADALIENGLGLDAWADVAVQGANNPAINRGARGRIDASRGLSVLDVPGTRVDRSMGDVHPQGNPHYSMDPGLAPIITQNILEGLAALAPENQGAFARNRAEFLQRVADAMTRWTATMEPFRGAKVIVYHPQWIYFLTRFGLIQAGALEDRPGIPASPGHLVRIIQQMKDEHIKVIVVEPWNDQKLAARVAEEAGGKAVVLASMVGGVKGVDSYLAAIDYNVKTMAEALR